MGALEVEDPRQGLAHPVAGERELVDEVRPVRAGHVVEHVLGIEAVARLEESGLLHGGDEAVGVAVHDDGIEARLEPLPLARLPPLDETEVEERDAAVVVEAVVPRVGVAVEGAQPLDRHAGRSAR